MLDRIWGAQEKHYVEPLELFTKDELKEAAIPEDVGLARVEAKIFSERLIRDFVISPTGDPPGTPDYGQAAIGTNSRVFPSCFSASNASAQSLTASCLCGLQVPGAALMLPVGANS